jgi:hypothetical protein
LVDLFHLIAELEQRKIKFHSLLKGLKQSPQQTGWSSTSPPELAEFKRYLIREKTIADPQSRSRPRMERGRRQNFTQTDRDNPSIA